MDIFTLPKFNYLYIDYNDIGQLESNHKPYHCAKYKQKVNKKNKKQIQCSQS